MEVEVEDPTHLRIEVYPSAGNVLSEIGEKVDMGMDDPAEEEYMARLAHREGGYVWDGRNFIRDRDASRAFP